MIWREGRGRWWRRVEENSGRAGWKGERRGEGREQRRKGRSENSRSVGRLVGRWFVAADADADAVASLCILILLPFRLQSLILILFFRNTDCCTVRGNTACPPLAQYHTKTRTVSLHLRSHSLPFPVWESHGMPDTVSLAIPPTRSPPLAV